MVEKSVHYPVEHQPRDCEAPSWEVFVRDDADDELHHVGALPAPSAPEAYHQARRLFGWFVHDLWLCPATEIHRYSAEPPSESSEPVDLPDGDEARTHED